MRHINLHNIIQLQCGVWRWVYPHVGQGILMIIHFIYKINKCQVSYTTYRKLWELLQSILPSNHIADNKNLL